MNLYGVSVLLVVFGALLVALERECRNKPNAQRARLGFN